MPKNLLTYLWIAILFISCASTSRNSSLNNHVVADKLDLTQPALPADRKPSSLMELPGTEEGGFVLAPGYYEADFKSYCLQPGTPDPASHDAYLQAPVQGYRKEIIETILYNSRTNSHLEQKNVQLLLWSVVSGSDYNKHSPAVQSTAAQLLSRKQLFELQGGVMGIVKKVSSNLPSTGHGEIKRLFEVGYNSYEAYERVAVVRQSSSVHRPDYKIDQWYKQPGNYWVRHFPSGYKNVKIQVYVPDGNIDSAGKMDGEYLVFDPTGMQAVPANSNAQRLGIGGPLLDIVRIIIKIEKKKDKPKTQPENKPVNKPVNIPGKGTY